jgi:hypothetical protein
MTDEPTVFAHLRKNLTSHRQHQTVPPADPLVARACSAVLCIMPQWQRPRCVRLWRIRRGFLANQDGDAVI